MKSPTFILLCLICVFLGTEVDAAGKYLYKFRDDKGQWVLQDHPPPQGAAEATIIELDSGRVLKYVDPDANIVYTDQVEQPGGTLLPAPARSTDTSPKTGVPKPKSVTSIVPSLQKPSGFPVTVGAVVTPLIDHFLAPILILAVAVMLVKLCIALVVGVPKARLLRVLFRGLFPYVKGWAGEARIRSLVKRLGLQAGHDLILPLADGRLTQVDHVVATHDGLLVIETKNYSGIVLGKEHEPRWMSCVGCQKNSFQNPLHQNELHLKAVRAIVTDVPVHGLVVFVGSAKFPNVMPLRVITLRQFKSRLSDKNRLGADMTAVHAALANLLLHSDPSPEARARHFAGLAAR